jgi:hypothetical protein
MPKVTPFQTAVGTAKYPHLNTPDAAFDKDNPKYKTELLMTPKEAEPLMKMMREAAADAFGNKKNIKFAFSKDEETGQVIFKVQSKYQPKYYDSNGQVITPEKLPRVSGGSRLKAAGILNIYSVSGTNGVGLLLDRVQLVKVVDGFTGDGGGFDAVEDGEFSIEDNDGEWSSVNGTPVDELDDDDDF